MISDFKLGDRFMTGGIEYEVCHKVEEKNKMTCQIVVSEEDVKKQVPIILPFVQDRLFIGIGCYSVVYVNAHKGLVSFKDLNS